MFKRTLALILVGVCLSNNGFAYPVDRLSLDPLIEEARKNNPDILAAKKRWEASNARIPQAKSLDDPVLSFTFEKTPGSPFQLSKTMSEDRMLSLSQFLPLFGKLSLKGKIAVVESRMFAAEYKNKELEVINRIKNAYYDLFMNYKEVGLNQESLVLLEGLIKVAEAKYAVGDMSQEEIYKLHSEAASLKNKIKNLQETKFAKQTILNALLNRDPEAPLGIPELSNDASFSKDIRVLYQSALLNQPELLIFSSAIERNKYAKSLAKKSFFPDLMAQIVERGFTTGTIGPWDLMLAFTVPLWFWTKQRYQVKEAIANLEEAEAAYKVMQNRAFAEVKDLAAKIEIAKNKIKLYKTDLIPILENSFEVSLASFGSGKSDFMALIDTQRMLIETRMDYYKALVEYNMALADLERAVGLSFNEKSEVKK
ncbi:MAG: TolC family protein [Candidatus Omnitrophica bacterium]|nr:TolC family protein [Candidatus Omnitrophota bacterium]